MINTNYRIVRANDRIKYAGTDEPSWMSLDRAYELCDKSAGEKIFEYDLKSMRTLWEVC